jgi:uncharacterized phage protein (TIGR01671 family)
MREIRFRGKCIEDCELKGQWLYGHYLKSASHFIAVDQGLVDGHFKLYQVDPETVGQYTGLKDRNGREIYEGDILRDDEMGLNVVRWEDGSFWLEMFYEGNQSLMEHLSDYNEVCEIIGNIYESHELLKGEETA